MFLVTTYSDICVIDSMLSVVKGIRHFNLTKNTEIMLFEKYRTVAIISSTIFVQFEI